MLRPVDTRRIIVGMMAALAIAPPAIAADACELLIPRALQERLARELKSNRLPRETDSAASSCVRERAESKASTCMLAARGDFDGDGRPDIAVLLPPRTPRSRPELVAALARNRSWKIEHLRIVSDPTVRHFVIERLPPRTYTETSAALDPGQTPRVLQSLHDGVLMFVCESWANGYFRVHGKWRAIALSD